MQAGTGCGASASRFHVKPGRPVGRPTTDGEGMTF